MSARPRWYFRYVWLTLGWLMVLGVIVGSLIRVPDLIDMSDGLDKIMHLLAYCAITGWFGQVYRDRKSRIWLVVAVVSLGMLLELAQGLTSWRGTDWVDVIANATGVVLAIALLQTAIANVLLRLDGRLATLLGVASSAARQ